MKSVWVIESGTYSDYSVDGIFSSEENAELALKMLVNSDASIAEWSLDPKVLEIRKGLKPYLVFMKRNGDVDTIIEFFFINDQEPDIIHRYGRVKYSYKDSYDVLRVYTWARDERHAIKIANEKRAQKIALGEWK